MKKHFFILVLLATFAVKAQNTTPIYQLRVYEIFEKNKKDFHDRFRDQAMVIMKKYNFKITSIWESKSENKTEFVYLLEWPDEATMKKAWENFKSDKDWIEIKKQTSAKFGDLVGNVEDRTLIKVNYSPN
jgi:hypothetical protein